MGDRAIEIGAVRIENGHIVERFQELMNPGFRISEFIEDYTGISNRDIESADCCELVMMRFADFIGDNNLVAHNASFDKRFLNAEFSRIGHKYTGNFACSMLIARRLFQNSNNHQLSTLVEFANIPSLGTFHRALYDSEMTCGLWLKMIDEIQLNYHHKEIPFTFLREIAKVPKKSIHKFLLNYNRE